MKQLPKFTLAVIFFFIFFTAAFAQDFTSGLIEYYPFTNGSADESHHSGDAYVNGIGNTRDLHGYIEGSPVLCGNTYFIQFPDSVNLSTPGWTYSVWF